MHGSRSQDKPKQAFTRVSVQHVCLQLCQSARTPSEHTSSTPNQGEHHQEKVPARVRPVCETHRACSGAAEGARLCVERTLRALPPALALAWLLTSGPRALHRVHERIFLHTHLDLDARRRAHERIFLPTNLDLDALRRVHEESFSFNHP